MVASRREAVAVWGLAVGQTLGYACFFYIFAALVLVWQRELPWSHGLLALGPLLSVGVTAALSPQVGRWEDQGHALRLMGYGTILGAAALVLLAMAWHPVTYLIAFAGLGAAAAMTLYEVCFALMIRRFGDEARGPITRVTLVAGLASTLAFPAGAWLSAGLGWRAAVWIAVVVVLGVMLPLQVWGARVLGGGRQAHVPGAQGAGWGIILARPGVLGLMALFALLSLDHWMLVSLLRPLLAEMDVPDGRTVFAASVIGPAQVLGRLALMGAGARMPTSRASVLTVCAMVLGPMLLLISGGSLALILAFAAVQGAAMGILTILRPMLVRQINGPDDYAAAAAAISLPAVVMTALAPLLGTWLLAAGGAAALLGVAFGLAVLAFAVLWHKQG